MRTNIAIDGKLMVNAVKACGAKTKKATVEKGLEILIQIERQSGLRYSTRQTALGRLAGRDAIGQCDYVPTHHFSDKLPSIVFTAP